MAEIAIFPIPNCTCFPGTVMPLHVFEPRYRSMVKHCLDNDMPMAVCHTQKVLKAVEQKATVAEALSSNQSTYKPYPVFSAGPCELMATSEDGRLALQVNMQQRYRWLHEVQSLPFMIAECEPLPDAPLSSELQAKAEQTQEKILHRLIAMTHAMPQLQDLLKQQSWQEKSPADFSFELLGLLRFGAEDMQQMLEMTQVNDRLERILQLINLL